MFKLITGFIFGYVLSDLITRKFPEASRLKYQGEVPSIGPATRERPEETTPRPAGSFMFPAGQRFPVEVN